MKLTSEIESEIKEMVKHYSKVMEFDRVPFVFFDRTSPAQIRGYPYRSRTPLNRIFGEAYRDIHGFLLNMEQFVELRGLHGLSEMKTKKGRIHTYIYRTKIGHTEETIIHEMVHLKYIHLRHGKGFERMVKGIYKSNPYQPNTVTISGTEVKPPVVTEVSRTKLLHRRRAAKQALKKKGLSDEEIEARLKEKFPTL